MSKHKVLILCTGNSCRSQMAEGIVRAKLGDTWEAYSAGTKPAGYVNPNALRVLDEIGIQMPDAYSKHPDVFREITFDVVVTVCDSAAEECPVWLGAGKKMHIGFPDPFDATGTEEEVLAVYRQVRDDIAEQIPPALESAIRA